MEFIVIIAVMGVAMYFLMIRPARKQQQQQQTMMNSLEVGSRVMLGSGIYGTIRHLGEKQAIIEISPGVDLTILRAAIRSVVAEEEEEFEYSDETPVNDQPAVDMDAFEADLAASAFAPEPDSDSDADDQGTADDADSPGTAPEDGDSEKNDEK